MTFFKRPLTLLAAIAAVLLLAVSSGAALRPHGSLSPMGRECRSASMQATLDRLSADKGFRRVATVYVLRREINPGQERRTVIRALWLRSRFELSVRFFPRLVTRIFCETADAKTNDGIIQTLPRIASLFPSLPPDDATRIGACIAVERKTVQLPLTSADIAKWQTDCSRRSSEWNQMWRERRYD